MPSPRCLPTTAGRTCRSVNVAPQENGEPVLLLSGLAWHTRNLAADPRASLLILRGRAQAILSAGSARQPDRLVGAR